jgi:tetratricopeptide (TPR) repeat protein
MGLPADPKRDVFIVHTKADPFEAKLVEAIKDYLDRWLLIPWVYEDWEWETEGDPGPRYRSYGRLIDPIRYLTRDPNPFDHGVSRREPDRHALAQMFENSSAIVLIAPRGGGGLTAGAHLELQVLERNPHPAVIGVSWDEANDRMLEEMRVVFNYRMPHMFPKDFSVPGESVARAAWLACMMERVWECNSLGHDLFCQLAAADPLLNRIASQCLTPVRLSVAPNRSWVPVLPDTATVESCGPLFNCWMGGAGYTANALTSGKPPGEIIEASKTMRYMMDKWCDSARRRFPSLDLPKAEVWLSLGAAKMRAGNMDEAIYTLSRGLDAPEASKSRKYLLLNRALAFSEAGRRKDAIEDYSQMLLAVNAELERNLRDRAELQQLRLAALRNRASVLAEAGQFDLAEKDFDEILRSKPLDVRSEALALVNRGDLKIHTRRYKEAIADYTRVIEELHKPPAVAKVKALLNRGAAYQRSKQHGIAIEDFDKVLALAETSSENAVRALSNRAHSYHLLRQTKKACKDYEAVLDHPAATNEMRHKAEESLEKLRRKSASA